MIKALTRERFWKWLITTKALPCFPGFPKGRSLPNLTSFESPLLDIAGDAHSPILGTSIKGALKVYSLLIVTTATGLEGPAMSNR